MSHKIRIGVSGDAGSFSEQAAINYTQSKHLDAELIYLTHMEGVLAALAANKIELGIFPVVNFRGGLVKMAFEAMGKYSFELLDEIRLDVRQCLMTLPRVEFTQIETIASHAQALLQCESYLKHNFPQVKLLEWEDTAKAAYDLANGNLPENTAVIAAENCAKIYQLKLIEAGIQTDKPNFTLFVVVK